MCIRDRIWGGLAPEHKTVSRSGENDREDSHRQESFTKVQSGPQMCIRDSCYTTEETEKLELMRLTDKLGGNIELAIKQLACLLYTSHK